MARRGRVVQNPGFRRGAPLGEAARLAAPLRNARLQPRKADASQCAPRRFSAQGVMCVSYPAVSAGPRAGKGTRASASSSLCLSGRPRARDAAAHAAGDKGAPRAGALPAMYRRARGKPQQWGGRFEEAGPDALNATRFAGLEGEIANGYANSLLQVRWVRVGRGLHSVSDSEGCALSASSARAPHEALWRLRQLRRGMPAVPRGLSRRTVPARRGADMD